MSWLAETIFLGFGYLMILAIAVTLVLQVVWSYLWKRGKIKIIVRED